MPNKELSSSSGYFTKKMLDILEKGETKPSKSTAKSTKANKGKKSGK